MADHEAGIPADPIEAAQGNATEEAQAVDDGSKSAVAAGKAAVVTEAAPEDDGPLLDEDGAAPMSKNQLKKLKKREAYEEKKRHKKEQEKLKRKEAQEIKKVKVKDHFNTMTPEELATWRAQRKEKVAARNNKKLEKKARLSKAIESGQRIVIDLEFPHLMQETELRSIAHQVSYSYSTNTKSTCPAHLILSGVQGTIYEQLNHHFPGFENWMVTSTEKSYLNYFSESKQDLIYLTADSPNELQVLDPGKIYIVGGIVDRNRHKNLCYNKAVEQGIATARLPIGDNIKLASSMVMCTNHVVDIMVKWMELRDWEAAFKAVIPTRKRKERDGGGGEEEGEEEEKGNEQEKIGNGIGAADAN